VIEQNSGEQPPPTEQ
jgi:hypothetical protein